MTTKDQPAQASGDSEEAVREKIARIVRAHVVEPYASELTDELAAALRHSQPSVQVEGATMRPLHELSGAAPAPLGGKTFTTNATPDHAAVVEALRAPLHELQADVDYLLGRVAVDGSSMSMVSAAIKKKLAAIEAALSTMSKAPQAGTSSDGDTVNLPAVASERSESELSGDRKSRPSEPFREKFSKTEMLAFADILDSDWSNRSIEMTDKRRDMCAVSLRIAASIPSETTPSSRAEPVASDHKTHLISEDYSRGYREGRAVERKLQTDLSVDRDWLGRLVREAWVKWALTQEVQKPHWLLPYDELSEPDKEADRQIGEALIEWAKEYVPSALSASPLSSRAEVVEAEPDDDEECECGEDTCVCEQAHD